MAPMRRVRPAGVKADSKSRRPACPTPAGPTWSRNREPVGRVRDEELGNVRKRALEHAGDEDFAPSVTHRL
ncbi:hypothetical protein GCM10010317_062810 [Streptomyces mirabilis]|nr:hypothetical protein GCM10010317_062810 [Streptomyces mirabilis]